MQFLLNNVVLHLDALRPVPRMSGRHFRALPFNVVSRLGQELFAEDPLLPYRSPERAARLASLIMAKAPAINAAQFIAPAFDCRPGDVTLRYANVAFEVMASLKQRQEQGEVDAIWIDRQVWRRLAA